MIVFIFLFMTLSLLGTVTFADFGFFKISSKNDQKEKDSLELHRESLFLKIHQPKNQSEVEKHCHSSKKPWEEDLTKFVHDNNTKTVLYMYYHDEPSRERALNLSLCHDWMFPIQLKLSRFAESQVYRDIFFHIQHYWKRMGVKYIILSSYKVLNMEDKYFSRVRLKDFYQYLQTMANGNYDLLPLVRHTWPFLPFAVRYLHGPHFKDAWYTILLAMGYTSQQIGQISNKKPGFYRSSMIGTRETIIGLTNFMVYATNLMELNTTVNRNLEVDSKYIGQMTKEQKIAAFGANAYTMYPFVGERLPIFYAYNAQLKICDGLDPACGANLHYMGVGTNSSKVLPKHSHP